MEKLKGEQFNIFSVLRMECKENATHSALIAELLNPEGSHLKGAAFLELFLKVVEIESCLDIQTACVQVEFHIGERDDTAKTGGRIDILISDKAGRSVAIENKIYAGDQYAQVERYCNYNTAQNTVLYLTLDGKEPWEESSGSKKVDEDFYVLSYREHISKWLALCLKEAADAPMLRESIKQYLNLIKKMTSTPDNQHEKELINLLRKNYDTAIYVKDNVEKVRLSIADEVREAVIQRLTQSLSAEFEIAKGAKIESRYAQIWIWHKEFKKPFLYFGVEPFNGWGNGGGHLMVGIFNDSGTSNAFTDEFPAIPVKHWYNEIQVKFEDECINFGNNNLISRINNSVELKDKLVEEIAAQVIQFVLSYEKHILNHLRQYHKDVQAT